MISRISNNTIAPVFLTLLTALFSFGCGKAAETAASRADGVVSSPPPTSTIETEIVAPASVAGAITATGKVLVAEDRIAVIGPVNGGRITRLFAGQGSQVKKGEKLAELESSDVDEAKSTYLKALADYENARRTSEAEIKLAQANYDRNKLLFEKTITAQKNFISAEHDLEVAKASAESSLASTKAALAAARRRLVILGLKEGEINNLASEKDLGAVFSITSPIAGVVVERNATIGATVGSDANLFKIIDLSSVWIDANVFEKDLERVKTGQTVNVSVPAFPGLSLSGKVILVSSVVDPDTRTVKVRTEVANHAAKLRPDMFANVQIVTDVDREALSVPMAAVMTEKDQSIVFVATGSGYERRVVKPGLQTNERVEILEGLKAGDKVVVKGNYLLLEQSKPTQ
jgi:membrane fusion protein, heavy metal efflux system